MGRVNGGLNLTRSFGDFDYKRNANKQYHQQMITCKPDIKEFDRSPDDEFIIMGCDGIWERYVQDTAGLVDKIRPDIMNGKQLSKIMEEMLDSLLAKETS